MALTLRCFQIDMSDSATSLSESMCSMMSMSASPPLLGPGEVLKPSGKFSKPTRIPGKKYCKDEVVIRNADSGKGRYRDLSRQKCRQHWGFYKKLCLLFIVMGIKGRRVHMIEELSETIISFQRGKSLQTQCSLVLFNELLSTKSMFSFLIFL
jgi:hypothetical protein